MADIQAMKDEAAKRDEELKQLIAHADRKEVENR
jgi:hypothetical protein